MLAVALALLIPGPVHAAAGAGTDGRIVISLPRDGAGGVEVDFRRYPARAYRVRVAREQIVVECTRRRVGGFEGASATLTAPVRRRRVRTGLVVRRTDLCTLQLLGAPDDLLAARAFSAFGRRELTERTTARRLLSAHAAVAEVRAHLGRYPTEDELRGLDLQPLADPAAPLAPGTIGVHVDAALERLHVAETIPATGRRVFVETRGAGFDVTFTTNVPRAFL